MIAGAGKWLWLWSLRRPLLSPNAVTVTFLAHSTRTYLGPYLVSKARPMVCHKSRSCLAS